MPSPIHYGGDYNPDQWPESIWEQDVLLMREAGVNLVSIGIFSWSRIQRAEGEFDWDWLDKILDLLHDNGIAVDLATPTASPPPWATVAYPEMLPRDPSGAVYWPGSRQHFAPTSADYRRLAAELVTELATRYSSHPAVVMWHVNNEYGCHLHYDYSDNARDAFRMWLKARYRSIDCLNEAWGTSFWSQILTSFDEVFPPRLAPYNHNPAASLDFRRFSSDAMLELFVAERDIIRASGAGQPITTNFMGMFPAADYWKWAAEVDFVSDDNYADPNDPESFRSAAFARDLMRSLKPSQPWVLMEQAANAVSWRPSNAPKAPGGMAALSMQALGHGADGIMFSQWRQSRKGSEKFHSAMVPHAGTAARSWREIVDLGRVLGSMPELGAPHSHARVAVVVDWENWWAIRSPDHPVELDYALLIQRWHAALHREHVSIDFVKPSSDLRQYSLVVAPQLYLLDDAGAANLRQFVQEGGHLVVGAFSDVVDETDSLRSGGYQVGLRDVLGVHTEEFGAMVSPSLAGTQPSGQNHAMLSGPFGDVRGEYLAETLSVIDAKVVATFSSGRTAGLPAIATRDTGSGRAYYLATIPDEAGTQSIARWALAEAGIEPLLAGLPEFVEVARRGEILTIINFGPISVDLSALGESLWSSDEGNPSSLTPFGVALFDLSATAAR